MSRKKRKDKIKIIIKLITDGKLHEGLKSADINDAEDLLGIGELFLLKKVYDVAERIFDRVVQLNPNSAEAWSNKGVALGNLGKYDQALKCCDEAIKINPNYAEAWSNKGAALGSLGKYDEELKCYDEAIKINPNYAETWLNKGGTLGNLGKYDEELKCYDEAIKINPNYAETWLNKGAALGNLGKYDEAVKCYDEAIKINPNYAEAWLNKGAALGNLAKYDQALKCCDEAIKINPNYAEAYANRGVLLLNTRNYGDAETELRMARRLFSKKGMKSHTHEAYRLHSLVINASKLISRMNPLDQQFLDCLNSESLTELKERSLEISQGSRDLNNEYKKRKLPKEVKELLIGKTVCFTVLSDVMSFKKKIDFNMLNYARKVFEKWDLEPFVFAVNSLDTFVRRLDKYGNIDEVPEQLEAPLLQVLSAAHLLDGVLTKEITTKIKGKPFTAKPTATDKKPHIQYVSITDTEKNWVRACLVQLDLPLTQGFPYALREKEKYKVREKVFEVLEIAKKEHVDIMCFPELSFVREWTDEIRYSYRDFMIICGSFYDESNRNLCQVIIDGKDYPYAKCHRSIMEESINGGGLKRGDRLFFFQTKYGLVSVLTCIDYDLEYYRMSEYVKRRTNKPLDIVINPRCDIDKEHNFQARSSLDIDRPDGSRSHTFILHINVKKAVVGNTIGGGGTSIICSEHRYRIENYREHGLRPSDGAKYKICEAKDEMILIADLQIAPSTERRTKMGEWYRHYGGHWKRLDDRSIWP